MQHLPANREQELCRVQKIGCARMTIRLKGKFSLICVMNRSDDRLSLLPQFNLRDIYLFFTVGCGSFVMETVLSILLHFTSTKRLLY